MKMRTFISLFLSLLFSFFISCNDPVFYTIFQEEEQLEPLISGSPTNFVFFKGRLYVASGTDIWSYKSLNPNERKREYWTSAVPGGRILQIAVMEDNYIFALCEEAGRNVLKRSSDGRNWVKMEMPWENDPQFKDLQSIHAAGNKLFLCAGVIGAFEIYDYDDLTTPLQRPQNRIINGVVFNGSRHFISTKHLIDENSGNIYIFESDTLRSIASGPFVGIICTENSSGFPSRIYAISRNSTLFEVRQNEEGEYSVVSRGVSMGRRLATGTLAVWTDKNNPSNKLLLAGRQDEMKNTVNYVHGYMEIVLDSEGNILGNFREPGSNTAEFSSIKQGDNRRYLSTIGLHPVSHIIQVPSYIDSNMVIFASTQKNGVWSYRDRNFNGDWLWNAEDY